MEQLTLIYGIVAAVFAALVAFTTTPLVRVIAYKIGAIDVPRDDRRMHTVPIPRMGGLAIFFGFIAATLLFCDVTPTLITIWFGGLILVAVGILDDIFALNAWLKLGVQILVAFIAVWQGETIEFINLFGNYITLGVLEIPITVLWIVGLTNAINLIDGLDGLSCGVSAISSISLLLVMLTIVPTPPVVGIIAILTGSCLGFLPFNTNPAKIFMGDTGALFLGYTLAVLSVDGVFKLHTVVSFLIPLIIFALPLFDTTFAFCRRILHGHSPFHPDRGHIHHRLIDMGFNQKQSVGILYAVCGILGTSAMMFTSESMIRAGIIIIVGLVIFLVDFMIIRNPSTREQAGLNLPSMEECAKKHRCGTQPDIGSQPAKDDGVSDDKAAVDAPPDKAGGENNDETTEIHK
ncbi:MAG: MraY family glycosyltransferase [Eubacteriales bacterium]